MSSDRESVSFKGTSFEGMESKVLSRLNKKRKSDNSDDQPSTAQKHKSMKPNKNSINSLAPEVRNQIKAFNNTKKSPITSKSFPVRTEPENSFNNDRTVYIQGIPFTCTEKEVTSFFKDCGEMLS